MQQQRRIEIQAGQGQLAELAARSERMVVELRNIEERTASANDTAVDLERDFDATQENTKRESECVNAAERAPSAICARALALARLLRRRGTGRALSARLCSHAFPLSLSPPPPPPRRRYAVAKAAKLSSELVLQTGLSANKIASEVERESATLAAHKEAGGEQRAVLSEMDGELLEFEAKIRALQIEGGANTSRAAALKKTTATLAARQAENDAEAAKSAIELRTLSERAAALRANAAEEEAARNEQRRAWVQREGGLDQEIAEAKQAAVAQQSIDAFAKSQEELAIAAAERVLSQRRDDMARCDVAIDVKRREVQQWKQRARDFRVRGAVAMCACCSARAARLPSPVRRRETLAPGACMLNPLLSLSLSLGTRSASLARRTMRIARLQGWRRSTLQRLSSTASRDSTALRAVSTAARAPARQRSASSSTPLRRKRKTCGSRSTPSPITSRSARSGRPRRRRTRSSACSSGASTRAQDACEVRCG